MGKVAVEDGHRPPVCPERVGISIPEEDALAAQPIEVRRYPRLSSQHFDGIRREALHQEDKDVRACRLQHLPRGNIPATVGSLVEFPHDFLPFLFREEIELCGEVLLLAQRGYQTEARVDGGMVQKLVPTEIHHTYVRRRGRYPTPDRDEHQPAKQQHRHRRQCRPSPSLGGDKAQQGAQVNIRYTGI